MDLPNNELTQSYGPALDWSAMTGKVESLWEMTNEAVRTEGGTDPLEERVCVRAYNRQDFLSSVHLLISIKSVHIYYTRGAGLGTISW